MYLENAEMLALYGVHMHPAQVRTLTFCAAVLHCSN